MTKVKMSWLLYALLTAVFTEAITGKELQDDVCFMKLNKNGKLEKYGPCKTPEFVLPCRQKDWTGWLNLDTPSLLCDCETLERAVATRGVCTRPTHIEVQLADGRPYTEGGNVVDISLETGFACWNDLQPDGMKCEDYMVRYCCPDEDNSSGDGSGLQVLLGG